MASCCTGADWPPHLAGLDSPRSYFHLDSGSSDMRQPHRRWGNPLDPRLSNDCPTAGADLRARQLPGSGPGPEPPPSSISSLPMAPACMLNHELGGRPDKKYLYSLLKMMAMARNRARHAGRRDTRESLLFKWGTIENCACARREPPRALSTSKSSLTGR